MEKGKEQGMLAVVDHAHFLLKDPEDLDNWMRIMWGKPEEGNYGSVTTALRLAVEKGAGLLIICSGIPAQGREVSPDVLALINERWDELPEECRFPRDKIIQLVRPQNTVQELEAVSALCAEHGVSDVILVSNPQHLVRVCKDAAVGKAEKGWFKGVRIWTTASDNDFMKAPVSGLTVLAEYGEIVSTDPLGPDEE